jgi:hypothetical protein
MDARQKEVGQAPCRLLPPSDAGRRLGGTATQTLAKWRVYGTGPEFVKIGKRVFYEESALDAYIAERRRRSTSEAAA